MNQKQRSRKAGRHGRILMIASCIASILAAASMTAGEVGGTITVSHTRLKTHGPKSEKHVVVYLEKKVPGSYPAPPAKHATMDQKGLVFAPHVMAVQKGTTVEFLNSDDVQHNIFCVDDCCKILQSGKKHRRARFMDLGNWGKGEVRSYTFNIPGEAVLLCKLHPEMAAYIVVLETPYFTVAEIDGATQRAEYTLKNVPPGRYLLKTWNKKTTSPAQELVVSEGKATRADIELVRKSRKHRRRS